FCSALRCTCSFVRTFSGRLLRLVSSRRTSCPSRVCSRSCSMILEKPEAWRQHCCSTRRLVEETRPLASVNPIFLFVSLFLVFQNVDHTLTLPCPILVLWG